VLRRVNAATALGVALALCLSGCGGAGVGGDQLPSADDPVAWAGRMCSAVAPLGALKGLLPPLDPNNPAASREMLSGYFGQAEQAAEQALTGLEQAGPSPVAGGDDAAAKLGGALRRLRDAYRDARAKIDAIDPGDPVGLGTQLPGIFTALAAASNDKDLASLGTNQALDDAVKKSPSCSLVPRS